jgi:hypothetical protein
MAARRAAQRAGVARRAAGGEGAAHAHWEAARKEVSSTMSAAARRQGGGGPRGAFGPAAGGSGRGRHARRFFAATVKHARHARGWSEGAKGAVTAELAATAFDPSDQRFDTWMRAAHEW